MQKLMTLARRVPVFSSKWLYAGVLAGTALYQYQIFLEDTRQFTACAESELIDGVMKKVQIGDN